MRGAWIAAGFALLSASSVAADEIRVGPGGASLDEALQTARPGDVVTVLGGTHENVFVETDGVTLRGRGATLRQGLRILGDDVVLEGFRVADRAEVSIRAPRAVVRGLRGSPSGSWRIDVDGTDALVEGNRFVRGGVRVRHLRAVVRRNRGRSAGVESVVADTVIEQNDVRSVIVRNADANLIRGNRARHLDLRGNRTVVEGNQIRFHASLQGDDLVIEGNEIAGLGAIVVGLRAKVRANRVERAFLGINVRGSYFEIDDNDVAVDPRFEGGGRNPYPDSTRAEFAAILVEGAVGGGSITRNRIRHARGVGIAVHADRVRVSGNTIRGVAPRTSIDVLGSMNVLSGNEIVHETGEGGTGDGVRLAGDDNLVVSLDVTGAAGDGVAVTAGFRNLVTGATLASSRGAGIAVFRAAYETGLTGVVSAGGSVGVLNLGTDTTFAGGRVVGGRRADVAEVVPFLEFRDVEYDVLRDDPALAGNR